MISLYGAVHSLVIEKKIRRMLGALLSSPALDVRLLIALQVLQVLWRCALVCERFTDLVIEKEIPRMALRAGL